MQLTKKARFERAERRGWDLLYHPSLPPLLSTHPSSCSKILSHIFQKPSPKHLHLLRQCWSVNSSKNHGSKVPSQAPAQEPSSHQTVTLTPLPRHHAREPTLITAFPLEQTPSPKCPPITKSKPPAGANRNRTKNSKSNRNHPSKPTATNPPPPLKTKACSSRTKPCNNSSLPCASNSPSNPKSKADASHPSDNHASWTGRQAMGPRLRV